MRLAVGIAGLLLLLAGTPVGAQRPAGRGWQDLSPDERSRAWQNYQRYRQLPEHKQRTLDRRYQQFRSMPPQEQDRLWRNYEHYRGLDPGQRQRFGEQYHRWRSGRHR
jgi:hypothetical protein